MQAEGVGVGGDRGETGERERGEAAGDGSQRLCNVKRSTSNLTRERLVKSLN